MNLRKTMIIAGLATAAIMASGFGTQHGKLVEDTYTVRQGDTLWGISREYMERNTYGPRDIREFMSGIVELNHDEVFCGRQPGMIYPGDVLRINYWIAEEAMKP